MIKVAIVDDHPIFCATLAPVINGYEGYQVTILAYDGLDLIEKIAVTGCPDIIILDLSMPKMNGTETAIWLRDNHPTAKIILLSSFTNEIVLVRLLTLGVRGFLAKSVHPADLKDALHDIQEKGLYFHREESKRIAELLASIPTPASSPCNIPVSGREIEFLKLCCSEYTMKEIANLMNLSLRTIDDLRDTLCIKLKCSGRLGIIVYALANGVIHL